jgi:hypothetical protein
MMTVDVGDSVQTKIIKSLPVSRTVLSFRMITSDHKLEGWKAWMILDTKINIIGTVPTLIHSVKSHGFV